MNQILVYKKDEKAKYVYKVQIIISIILIIVIFIFFLNNYKNNSEKEKLSKIYEKSYGLNILYNTEKIDYENNYLGKIYIEKINFEYVIFNEYSEELLKIAPCKFYGVDIGEDGNLCISAHNYNDDRFLGRVRELHVDDEIVLENNFEEKFIYKIYSIFETRDDDLSILKSKKQKELTLVTCNNSNKKRVIIKAYCK